MSVLGLLHCRLVFEPSSSRLAELAIVSHSVFGIISVWLKIKFWPEFAREPLAPLPIWINGNNAGRTWPGQHHPDQHLWACAAATDKPPQQVDKASQMPATTDKTQVNLADSSKKETSRSNIDLDRALLIINQIGQNLTASLHLLDVTSVCRTVLGAPELKELFNFDVAEICLWNDQSQTLTTELRVPEDEPDLQAYDRTYSLNEGYTGWIAANQQPLLINDTRRHPDVVPKMGLEKFRYRSLMGVPLQVGLKLLGTIELATAPADAYTQQHVILLEVVANQVAIALDHARLFRETQHKVAELSVLFDAGRELSATLSYDQLLHNLSRQMIKAFAADDCAIFDFDEATGTLNLIHECGDSIPDATKTLPDFSKEAFCRALITLPAWETTCRERTPLIIRLDGPTITPAELDLLKQCHCGSIVGLPLVSRDRFAGLLTLFAIDPQALADEQIPLAQSLASQAHIALENARLFGLTDQRLHRRIDELAGLQRVSSELNSTLDLDRILDLVLEEAMRATHANLGNVDVYDVGNGELIARKEQYGVDATPSADASLDVTVFGQKIIDRSLQTGEAALISDVRHDEDYAGFGEKTRSRVIVPIFYGTVPTGVINLESDQVNFFTDNQLRYLESLALQAAVAIGNAQTYEEQRREREQASRRIDQLSRLAEISNIFRTNRPLLEVLEDIAYAISESVGYKVVLVSLVQDDPPALYPRIGAGIPIMQFREFCKVVGAQSLTGLQAVMLDEFRLSKSYFIPIERREIWQDRLNISYAVSQGLDLTETTEGNGTAWQAGDLVFMPLTDTADNIIGLLTVEDPDTGERPTISSIETLEIFANHAATAIENALLFEREQQRRRIADTLRGVAEAISSQLEFDDLLNIVLRELANVLAYDSASVHRLEEDRVEVIGGRAWESSQQMMGTTYSMTEVNPHRLVIETQEPVIIQDVRLEYPGSFAKPPYDRVRSWLGVPLTYGTNILGLMSLGSTEVDYFTPEDAEVLLAFANQVAVAMQNARLFDEARQQVRQLAALTEVAQSLNRALDLNEVLNLVLDAVFDLVGGTIQGSIWLVDNYTNTIKIANTQNISDFMVELFNESAISVDSEPFAAVIKSGEVQVIESSVTDRSSMGSYGLLPFPDDVTYVPLKTEQGVIGILAIETVIHHRNMLELVTTLADLAAIAIDNTRLLENTEQRANEMQSLYNLGVEVSGMLKVQQVMSSVVDNAITLTDTQLGVILFWDEETQQYIVEGSATSEKLLDKLTFDRLRALSQPVPRQSEAAIEQADDETDLRRWYDLTQQIMESNQPINVSSLATSDGKSGTEQAARTSEVQVSTSTSLARTLGIQAMLGVPIRVQNEASGAIFVGSLSSRNFDDHDIRLLSFVANQSAVAIRNAQLVQRLNLFTEELEQRVAQRTEELARTLQDLTDERDRVESLYQITRELSASLDLDRILTQALSLINRAVGISHGSILLLEQGTNNLIYRASLGRDMPLPRGDEAKAEIDYRLAEIVVETNQYQIIADLSDEPDFVVDPESLDRHSAMAVPLVTGDEVAGALLLFHPEVDYFTEDHFKLVSAAAAQVATAINNAELYRLITDQADRLGVMLRTQAAEAAKNEAILRGITDGVLVLDAERNVVLFNPKAAEILEVNPVVVENQPLDQILGRSTSPVAQELAQRFYDNFLESLEEIDAGEPSAEFRIEVKPKAVVVTLAPVFIASEELPSIVTVLRDISKEAEIERIKNEFISTVSHELRTPLTSIKGYADLLVSASASAHVGELNPTQHRFIEVIQSNTNRLANLVNDILEISRIETGRVKLEFESIDIINMIKEVAVSFEGQLVQKPMNFSLDLPPSLPHVYADRARVAQILVNLIGNAWRYTPEGGDIKIQARLRDDNLVQIDVKDTGIGIVEEDLPYIFDRFFRSERGEVAMVDGTGLGLSITKSFVDLLGGDIWVESKLDIGSTFSFTLPLESAPGKMAAPTHVLLIDDDAQVVRILKPELEKTGYQVTTTANGAKALEMARKAGENLSLIILDALLKDTDGFELLAQFGADESVAHVPVLMTALSVDQNGKDLVLEVIDYVSTSFDMSNIMETVGLALNRIKAPQGDNGKEISVSEKHLDHVLIVSNNPETAKLLKDALDNCGCYAQRAFNSQQALDMAASNPDLILVDPKMPEVDGKTIITQLRQAPETKDIPLIVITDRVVPQKSNAVKMLSSHNQTRIVHSFSVDALVAEIARIDHNLVEHSADG